MHKLLFAKYLIVLTSLVATGSINAQVTTPKGSAPPPMTPSPLDQFLYQAITPAVYVIRVDYVLRETKKQEPQDFGRDTLPYFGRLHGLAIASDGRFWFDPRLLKPWLYADSINYNDVKDENLYYPVVKQIQFRTIHGQKFERYNFQADSILTQQPAIASLPMSAPTLGLLPVIPRSDSSTVLLLFTTESAQRMEVSDSAAVRIEIPSTPIVFNDEGKGSYKLPLIARLKPVLGGLLCSVEPSTGNIQFKFAGILVPTVGKSGDLELLVPPYSLTADPTAPPPPAKPVLTPINDGQSAPNKSKGASEVGKGDEKSAPKQKKNLK
jgi:hypothetical protein